MADEVDQIRVIAYHLWDSRGRPDGAAIEHWIEAQRVLAHGSIGHDDIGARASKKAPKKAATKQMDTPKGKRKS